MSKITSFFRHKKPWSKYKDLILDYYLEPYLNKVKTLKKPIVVIDCFAGPGKYDDGEPGSPQIIANKLRPLYERGIDVQGIYIEANPELYKRLQINAKTFQAPHKTLPGNFRSHLEDIAQLAKTHTVFVYLDPFRPKDLYFNDLKLVYDQLQSGQSIETLINFMSPSFLRGIMGGKKHLYIDDVLQTNQKQVLTFDRIAGGTYWHQIVFNESISTSERIDKILDGFKEKLKSWFEWVLAYPIRDRYENEWPKYHLVFGSRHNQAVDLMNRAMVKARREFVGNQYVNGMLFPNQPEEEIPDPAQIMQTILETSKNIGKTTWQLLRAHTTVEHPCMYTDSEYNREIKRAIKDGKLGSTCLGNKIQEDAYICPLI